MRDRLDALYQRLTGTVLGAEEPAYLLMVALVADGHALIQGAPGIGKTSLAETLAKSLGGRFHRVQFTPDLLPADLMGYSMFHQGRGEFEFVPGPVFCNVLLADEINRTSPRVQSALLECMNERQVSIDGVTRPLDSPYMVVATQNSLYASGTFPLPEPQLDRFLVSISMLLPDAATQSRILALHASGRLEGDAKEAGAIISPEEVLAMQEAARAVPVSGKVCDYITAICEGARRQRGLLQGISARAAIALMRASQAVAFMEGHSAVFPDDVKAVAAPVLCHRMGEGGNNAISPAAAVEEVLRTTEVP